MSQTKRNSPPGFMTRAIAVTVASTLASSNNVSNQPGGDRVDPYYLELRLPGSKKDAFTLLRPFVATSKNNATRALTAFLAVSMLASGLVYGAHVAGQEQVWFGGVASWLRQSDASACSRSTSRRAT